MRVGRAFQIPQRADFAGLTIEATALYALSTGVPQETRDEAIGWTQERIAQAADVDHSTVPRVIERAVHER
jgi:hypothetical protein